MGAGDAFALDGVGGFAEAGRVEEADEEAVEDGVGFEDVAGGARNGRDDGAVASGEPIQEGGFARVGRADEGDAQAFAEDAALVPGGKEGGEAGLDGARAGEDGVGDFLGELVVGEIEHGLGVGRQGDQFGVEGGDARAEGVVKLVRGQADGAVAAGADEVHDRLGLGEVHFSVQEGAFREFAGPGEARAGLEEGVQDGADDAGVSVAVDFGGVFAGVGLGSAENEDEDVVERGALGVEDAAVEESARGRLRGESGAAEEAVEDWEGRGARQPDDGNGAFAGRRGLRGDGILEGGIHRRGEYTRAGGECKEELRA